MEQNHTADIVLDAIRTRRSVRKFKDTPVPDELIDKVIEAGTYAASGKSMQPWKVVVVGNETDRELFRKSNALIMGKSEDADPFYGAPAMLLILGERSNPNYIYDCSLMMGNMMLAAHVLGLGSCWINRAREEFETPEWKEWLQTKGIEGDYAGVAHLILGYPEGTPHPAKPRRECVVRV